MNEIYWITRLDAANALLLGLIITSAVLWVICLFCLLAEVHESNIYVKKFMNGLATACVIFILGFAFTPTKEEALMIWGIGASIDYLKQNETAKQLPDKCIQALDAWIECVNDKDEQDDRQH